MPFRRCAGCGGSFRKDELLRLVLPPDGGQIAVDISGKAQGRGAYLCRKIDCLLSARKKKGLERSFRRKLPEGFYEKLMQLSEGQGGGEIGFR